jgi:hypothetical protein
VSRRLRRWIRWLWPLPAVLACARPPDPLTVADKTCWSLVIVDVIRAGRCDAHAKLDDCPEYVAAMAQCEALRRAAALAGPP